jgi:hypothetical protein
MVKAKLQLIIILGSIFYLDLSCDDEDHGGCGQQFFDVVGLQQVQILKIDSNNFGRQLTRDSIPYDSVRFVLEFEETLLSSNTPFQMIGSANATPPCPTPNSIWELDSVKIFSIVGSLETEITSSFSLHDTYRHTLTKARKFDPQFLRQCSFIVTWEHGELYFELNKQPLEAKSAQYKFQFFDKKGRVFTKTSDPVVITP